ncbi:MAG: hypothetical protein LBG46_00545 [Elusimicrobiota bacterium]|nr:hypothetical protein [Elusimicrobiota bacterium]
MKQENKSGTYVFDKKTGRVVKISNEVPSVKKEHKHVCQGNCCRNANCPKD